jgi:protein O-GlcNAc transferase
MQQEMNLLTARPHYIIILFLFLFVFTLCLTYYYLPAEIHAGKYFINNNQHSYAFLHNKRIMQIINNQNNQENPKILIATAAQPNVADNKPNNNERFAATWARIFAQNNAECSARLGNGLISRWLTASHSFCSSPGQSSLVCYSLHIAEMPPKTPPHSFCIAKHAALQFQEFSPASAPKYRADYFLGEANELFRYNKGAFLGNCREETGPQKLSLLSADHMRDLIDGFEGVTAENSDKMKNFNEISSGNYQNHSLLVVVREGLEYANLYHTLTDFYNTFLAISAFNLPPNQIQLLLSDNHKPGPFDSVWKKLFSSHFDVLRPSVLAKSRAKLAWRDVVFVPAGYSSPLYVNLHSEDSCHAQVDSFAKFSQFVQQQFGLNYESFTRGSKVPGSEQGIGPGFPIIQSFSTYNHSAEAENSLSSERILHLVFVSRRPYTKFVDHRKISRRIFNEDKLLSFIPALRPAPGSSQYNIRADLIDFALLSFEEQLRLLLSTDILIGAHGAALSHAVFLSSAAYLLELHPQLQDWRCFEHIAEWSGSGYEAWRNNDPAKERSDEAGSGMEVNQQQFEEITRRILGKITSKLNQHNQK